MEVTLSQQAMYAAVGRLYLENVALQARLDELEMAIREAAGARDTDEADEAVPAANNSFT